MKKTLKILAWTAGTIAALMLILDLLLSPAVATRIANRYASEIVGGEIHIGKAGISLWRRFPAVSLRLKDVTLASPADSLKAADTLAYVGEFKASVNALKLIGGTVRIPDIRISQARISAKMYSDSTANWDFLGLGGGDSGSGGDSEEAADTTSSLPKIELGKIQIDGNSMVAFSTPEDTLLLALDYLRARFAARKVNMDASANVFAATRGLGRMDLPLMISARAAFPEERLRTIRIEEFRMKAAGVPLEASGLVSLHEDRIYVDGVADMDKVDLEALIGQFGKNFYSEADKIHTDACLSAHAKCRGDYVFGSGKLPEELYATLTIPRSTLSHDNFLERGEILLNLVAETRDSLLHADLSDFAFNGAGLRLTARAKASDVLGDGLYDFKADLGANLDSLVSILPEELGVRAHGSMKGSLKGKVRQSQLTMANIAKANLEGYLSSDCIDAEMPLDTISAHIENIDVKLAATGNRFYDGSGNHRRMLALTAHADSLNAKYKDYLFVRGKDIEAKAMNSADILNTKKKLDIYPFAGTVSAKSLSIRDVDSTFLLLRNTRESFSFHGKKDNRKTPVVSIRSKSEGVVLRSGANRMRIKGLAFNARATMNGMERKERIKVRMDSIAKANPGVPRDTLVARMREERRRRQEAVRDDYRSKDISFSLDESIKKYYREWDVEGQAGFERANIMTPYFPLRTRVGGTRCSFTNDMIELDSLSVKAGNSDLRANGKISGLRAFLLRHGILDIDLKLGSREIDVNQLLGALQAGADADKVQAESLNSEQLSDEQYAAEVLSDSLYAVAESPLVVLPGNVDARVSIDAGQIRYSDALITSLGSELTMKGRTLQVKNTIATADFGNAFFDGFYATRSKDDIKTGFSLNLTDVNAEDVIDLMPAIDTIVPLLSSFSGLINCEVAATASLDTNMNIIVPSMSGVVRISGNDLAIYDSEDFHKLAKTLMFKNKRSGYVDELKIEGLLSDSRFEVFPFVLMMDRYRLALSGIQDMSAAFKYHVAVMKSPLLFKFGVDLWGDDFDNMRFRIGKAKYRNVKNIPIFSDVIDNTRLNLSESIRNIFLKGVDKAISENEAQSAIREFKARTDYVAAVDMPLDTLSGTELRQLDSLMTAPEEPEEESLMP